MTITHNDFFRILPKALKNKQYYISGLQVAVNQGDRSMRLTLSPESVRQIGSLRLPVTEIEMYFSDYSNNEVSQFLQQFDLAYQKGGG